MKTDSYGNGRGFRLSFQFVPEDFYTSVDSNYAIMNDLWLSSYHNNPQTGVQTGGDDRCAGGRKVIVQNSGCIHSPNYGTSEYYADDTCNWLITSEPGSYMTVTFESFALATNGMACDREPDHVDIFDGDTEQSPPIVRFCGSMIPPSFDTPSNVIFVKFNSGSHRQLSGFKMCWSETKRSSCNQSLVAPLTEIHFSASSHFTEQVPALAKMPSCCWSTRLPTEPGAFLQIDLKAGRIYSIRSIAIRGNPKTGEWVTQFAVSYQMAGGDTDKWFEYLDDNGFRKTFDGNVDASSTAIVHFNPPISSARAIRILPLAAHQWIALSVDVFGCEDSCKFQ